MGALPEIPDPALAERVSGDVALRYEEVTEDGRVTLLALPAALETVVWRHLGAQTEAMAAMRAAGVFPITTRFVLEGGGGPVSATRKLHAACAVQLAHSVGEGGEVERLFLLMWAELSGDEGRTHEPRRAGAERLVVGRAFVEHVFTRPFAPPGERKVSSLDLPGLQSVPPQRWAQRSFDAGATLPEDAIPLADEAPDDAPFVVGLAHTDSNQHVNSLVYPRLFEDALLRRIASLGRPTATLLSRSCDVAWRKPCFAGETMRWMLRPYARAGRVGAVGTLVPDGDRTARPSCAITMELEG